MSVMYIISRRATQGLLSWRWWEDPVLSPCKEGNHEGTKFILCSEGSVRFGSPPISLIPSYLRSDAWWVEITLRGALPVFPSRADVSTVTERLSSGTRAAFAGYFGWRNNVPSRRNAWASMFVLVAFHEAALHVIGQDTRERCLFGVDDVGLRD